jgi:hypothetical protein
MSVLVATLRCMELIKNPAAQDNPAVSELEALASRIVAGAGRLAAATCEWLLAVAAFDAVDGAWEFGLASTIQWLTHTCSIAARTAADQVRVARALAAFPNLAAAMHAGNISYSQARAIARVAHPGEDELVDDLLIAARFGTVAQLEVLARGLRTVDANENPIPREDREYVKHRWADDATWALSAKLDPERGALLDAALTKVAEAEELSATDALVRLAEIGLTALADDTTRPRHLRGDEQAAVVIHLDTAQLTALTTSVPGGTGDACDEAGDGSAEQPAAPARPLGRIANGPGLPRALVERLLCAGRIRTVVLDGKTHVLDVGRSQRLVTDKQYRALLHRQHGHCGAPGCPNEANLHAHHVLYWWYGGRTDLNNLVLLCQRHHIAHHDGAFRIINLGHGTFRFETPTGTDLAHPIPHTDPGRLPSLETEHPDIAPNAITSEWDGQRLQHHYAVSVLAERRYSALTC